MHPGKEPSEPCPRFTNHSVKLCELLHEKMLQESDISPLGSCLAVIFARHRFPFCSLGSDSLKSLYCSP